MQLSELIKRLEDAREPRILLVKTAGPPNQRLGVFASSFNPPTVAHSGLINAAREQFSLDEILTLVTIQNADKSSYDSALADRVSMMREAFGSSETISIGLCSHAFFVDMIDALDRLYSPAPDLHFILGFDTFERVIDPAGSYLERYHRSFPDSGTALQFLLDRASLIVAGRGSSGRRQFDDVVSSQPARLSVDRRLVLERVHYLATPAELADRSASEVRALVGSGQSIEGLVPPSVARYIEKKGLYK
jgi:nicotinate (nicotinamide) nucleotide adenylyltransferase